MKNPKLVESLKEIIKQLENDPNGSTDSIQLSYLSSKDGIKVFQISLDEDETKIHLMRTIPEHNAYTLKITNKKVLNYLEDPNLIISAKYASYLPPEIIAYIDELYRQIDEKQE